MNPDIKALWIATLRSGNYKQGRAVLRADDNSVCCLGVLCDIVEPERWRKDKYRDYCHGKYKTLPSPNIEIAAGLEHEQSGKLAEMNDNGYSFPEIADYIERNL